MRLALSPDPATEDAQKDLNLRELTDQAISRIERKLKQKYIQYIATEHTDQTEIRHVHIIALVKAKYLAHGQIPPDKLDELKAEITAATIAMNEEPNRQKARSRAPEAPAQTPSPKGKTDVSRYSAHRLQARPAVRERSGGSMRLPPPLCPNCGLYAEMVRRGRFYACPICGLEVTRSMGLGLELQKSAGLELSLEEVAGI